MKSERREARRRKAQYGPRVTNRSALLLADLQRRSLPKTVRKLLKTGRLRGSKQAPRGSIMDTDVIDVRRTGGAMDRPATQHRGPGVRQASTSTAETAEKEKSHAEALRRLHE